MEAEDLNNILTNVASSLEVSRKAPENLPLNYVSKTSYLFCSSKILFPNPVNLRHSQRNHNINFVPSNSTSCLFNLVKVTASRPHGVGPTQPIPGNGLVWSAIGHTT